MAINQRNDRLRRQSSARKGRILWVVLAAVFLLLVTVTLWVWVRTRAAEGYGAGRFHHSLEEADSDFVSVTEESPVAQFFHAEDIPVSEMGSGGETSDDEIVYHSRKNDRMEIALSFDDGPHPRLTPIILDILEEYGIKATFFMVGENVGYYPAAARAVVEAGHEIGNHTFSHRKFGRMTEHEMLDEIASCEDAIASVSENPVHFIRPPEGQMSDAMRRVVGTLHYRIILWDVDTRDWAHTPPAEISRHILDTVQAGDIILMHDFIGHDSPTPEALRMVIPELLARGYRFVTVGELVDGD
ncbi:MAG: hypothetical protein E7610_01385 [Ruminococcaceae bacterium]|nr:hypothetical protein [Oscillospiraceae bacterium]